MPDTDPTALDGMAVVPPDPAASDKDQSDAGRDESIAERLQQDPEDQDAQLDNDLDQSMDASDPLSATQPARNSDPAPSSGYDADAEADRRG